MIGLMGEFYTRRKRLAQLGRGALIVSSPPAASG